MLLRVPYGAVIDETAKDFCRDRRLVVLYTHNISIEYIKNIQWKAPHSYHLDC